MCDGCVREYMESEGLSEMTVPVELRPLCSRIRAFHDLPDCGTGGPLHIVLDDANVEDDHITWCLTEFRGTEYDRYDEAVWSEAESIAADLLAIPSLAMRAFVTVAA